MLGPLLQYQSLKTVLLHTDANTRFRISAHMPSIRDVEKLVPLKISNLDISHDWTTVVNHTEYDVGIIRHYPEGNVPSPVARENNFRGSLSDFDEFGFQFDAGNNVVLPGDVSFQLKNRPEFRQDTEEFERGHRGELRRHEKALKMQEELKSKGMTVEDYLKNLGQPLVDVFYKAFAEEARRRFILMSSPERIPDRIEYFKLELLPFDCRRNNTKPPFTCYIQLTITNGESRQIHRFEYNKKLFEVSKHIREVLFGRRKAPVQVGRLFLNEGNTIYRLPLGVRLHAKHVLTYESNLVHPSFLSIVENSERLESIEITYGRRGDALQTEAVRRVKHLVIGHSYNFEMQRLNLIIQNLPNLEITIVDPSGTAQEKFNLIQAWLSAERPVGASFCIELQDKKRAEKDFRLVQTRYERANKTNRCVTIDQTNSTKVEVFYAPFKPPRSDTSKWILKTRIINA